MNVKLKAAKLLIVIKFVCWGMAVKQGKARKTVAESNLHQARRDDT